MRTDMCMSSEDISFSIAHEIVSDDLTITHRWIISLSVDPRLIVELEWIAGEEAREPCK